jgi:hypothetical protein
MKGRDWLACCLIFLAMSLGAQNPPSLKSVIHDFEGLDIGQTQMPDGIYRYGDLSCRVAANPLGYTGMTGDRSAELTITWAAGYAAFGRGITRYIEINPRLDQLNFYFYNPSSNSADARMNVIITEDDNNDGNFDHTADDSWIHPLVAGRAPGWQMFSLRLADFTDENAGGNGIFDAAYTNAAGKIFKVEFRFSRGSPSETSARYFIDMICFSEGKLAVGTDFLERPRAGLGDYCLLGAYGVNSQNAPEQVPSEFESQFLPARKIRYVNTFLAFSNHSTTPSNFPGKGIQTLLDNGYVPIITWEPFFSHLAPLDPAQPRLADIVSGKFDSYIDAMGDVLKSYTDTVIVRPMHEFDGNWYPWCISVNGKDPALFVAAFRRFVDRCRARGANNVKWMWCPNSSPAPNDFYNWCVQAYPGDSYVDIVATNIYNHPYPGTPTWRSFRYLLTEVYHYLRKYFPSKVFFITEVASRERYGSENPSSQTKAAWIREMDRELQGHFSQVRALISFNVSKEHNWKLGSSPEALSSYQEEIWKDDYYFRDRINSVNIPDISTVSFYPNPSSGRMYIKGALSRTARLTVFDTGGAKVLEPALPEGGRSVDLSALAKGIYIFRIEQEQRRIQQKIILQ